MASLSLSLSWITLFEFSDVIIQGQFAFVDMSEWTQMLEGVSDLKVYVEGEKHCAEIVKTKEY